MPRYNINHLRCEIFEQLWVISDELHEYCLCEDEWNEVLGELNERLNALLDRWWVKDVRSCDAYVALGIDKEEHWYEEDEDEDE